MLNKKILTIIKQLDFFAKPVRLFIHGDDSHRTIFGAIATILIVIVVSVMLISNIYSLWTKENPTLLTQQTYHYSPPEFTLGAQNFTLQLALQNSTFQNYVDPSIYQIKAYFYKKHDFSNVFQKIEVPLTRCSNNSYKQKDLQNIFNQIANETMLCIDWSKFDTFSMMGSFTSKSYHYLMFEISSCHEFNESETPNQCQNKQSIIEKLSNNFLSLQVSSNVLSLQDYKKEFTPFVQDFYSSISTKIYKEIVLYFQTTTLKTDKGIIFEDIYQDQCLIQSDYREILDLSSSELLARVILRLSPVENVINRSYPKLQSILAESGGLWKMLFTIVLILQTPVRDFFFRLRLINSLFNFEGQVNRKQEQKTKGQSIDDLISQQKCIKSEINNKLTEQNTKNVLEQQNQLNSQVRLVKMNSRRSSHKNQSLIRERLKSIQIKQSLLNHKSPNSIERDGVNKTLSLAIKKFFSVARQKLEFTVFQFFCCPRLLKQHIKINQFEYANERMLKSIDILHIITKLSEIDKLKMILLNSYQIKMFDYLPKPMIFEDPKAVPQTEQEQYYTLLQKKKNNLERAKEAQQALQILIKNYNDPINQRLLMYMDEHIIDLLNIQFGSSFHLDESSSVNEEYYANESNRIMIK